MLPKGSTLVQAIKLVKDYATHDRRTRVVDNVSFSLHRGETFGLVGESGSGKSTIARMVLRLIEPTAGKILFNGDDLSTVNTSRLRMLRRQMQIVFQDPYASLNPRMSVRQILAEPFAVHHEPLSSARLLEVLTTVGLDGSALPRYPHEFSGGQRQRINIARAVVLRPELLVLDEPVSALDVSVGAQVVNLLRDLQRAHGLTYLFISHSMPLVRYLCDRIAVLQHGKLVEIGTSEQLCFAPTHSYTRQLLAATPELPSF